jgi:hypothetical protein
MLMTLMRSTYDNAQSDDEILNLCIFWNNLIFLFCFDHELSIFEIRSENWIAFERFFEVM